MTNDADDPIASALISGKAEWPGDDSLTLTFGGRIDGVWNEELARVELERSDEDAFESRC